MEVDDESMTDFDAHESGLCQGLGSCTFCQAEDLIRAEKIKNATRRLDYESVATEATE